MGFQIYYRKKTTEKMNKSVELSKEQVLEAVSKLLDTEPIIKLKIVKVGQHD